MIAAVYRNRLTKTDLARYAAAVLHPRLPNSFQRTAALLLSAFCLYIPANIFPIMTVTRLGVGEPHTIIGGIIALINGNMVPIAMLVLVASILVPLLKLLGHQSVIAQRSLSLASPCQEMDYHVPHYRFCRPLVDAGYFYDFNSCVFG